jgi:hypothetical protein
MLSINCVSACRSTWNNKKLTWAWHHQQQLRLPLLLLLLLLLLVLLLPVTQQIRAVDNLQLVHSSSSSSSQARYQGRQTYNSSSDNGYHSSSSSSRSQAMYQGRQPHNSSSDDGHHVPDTI